MAVKISNQFLSISFKAKGAELVSVRNTSGLEYLWQADPDFWGRFAPVLFPFVGRLKNDQFEYEGESFPMNQHGFARDMDFEIANHQLDSITFQLLSNSKTRQKYPFLFELQVSYHLVEGKLDVGYEIRNTGKSDMYFSIGGHPAFNCPMIKNESREDYWLEFSERENLVTHRLEDGLFSGKTETIAQNDKLLQIRKDLFDHDALVFKNLISSSVSLCGPTKKWLTFHFDQFPYLGIWSKSADAAFVCIEPWQGLADHQDHEGDLHKKEGIIRLKKSKTFRCNYQIDFH